MDSPKIRFYLEGGVVVELCPVAEVHRKSGNCCFDHQHYSSELPSQRAAKAISYLVKYTQGALEADNATKAQLCSALGNVALCSNSQSTPLERTLPQDPF